MAQTLAEMIEAARSGAREVEPSEAKHCLDDGEIGLVLDVREPHEFEQCHLPAAANVPRGLLEIKADPSVPVHDEALTDSKDMRILVYCMKDPSARSLLAAETLGRMGYENVEVLRGGLAAWREDGLPVEESR